MTRNIFENYSRKPKRCVYTKKCFIHIVYKRETYVISSHILNISL